MILNSIVLSSKIVLRFPEIFPVRCQRYEREGGVSGSRGVANTVGFQRSMRKNVYNGCDYYVRVIKQIVL